MVLCFHVGFGWMGGGYFGVSIFFTLSGFLITTLLVNEHERTGAIALGSFIARRAKRLLPASLACIALVSVARLAGQFDQVPGLRRELLGATAHVCNWVKLGGDTGYTDVFTGSAVFVSPLEHYWSLAIEEQFYLLWPLTVALLARRVTRWSLTLPVLFLAAALATLAVVLPTASGPAYAGLFAPLAALSAVMLWSLQVAGPVRRALSSRPLVQLGQISYGARFVEPPARCLLRR